VTHWFHIVPLRPRNRREISEICCSGVTPLAPGANLKMPDEATTGTKS
jgi:hypothetical protein